MPKVALNSPAPDFQLEDMHGTPVRLSGYKDRKNVLLVFNRGFV